MRRPRLTGGARPTQQTHDRAASAAPNARDGHMPLIRGNRRNPRQGMTTRQAPPASPPASLAPAPPRAAAPHDRGGRRAVPGTPADPSAAFRPTPAIPRRRRRRRTRRSPSNGETPAPPHPSQPLQRGDARAAAPVAHVAAERTADAARAGARVAERTADAAHTDARVAERTADAAHTDARVAERTADAARAACAAPAAAADRSARRHQRRRCGNGERKNRSVRTHASVFPLFRPSLSPLRSGATGTDGAGKALSAVAIGGSPKDQRMDHGCILR